jgi:hypothetical protein
VVLVSSDGSTALVYGGLTGASRVRGAACCSTLLSLCRHCRRPHRADGRTHPRPRRRSLECRRACVSACWCASRIRVRRVCNQRWADLMHLGCDVAQGLSLRTRSLQQEPSSVRCPATWHT